MNRIEAWERWKRPEWRQRENRIADMLLRGKTDARALERLVPRTDAGLFDLRGFPLVDHKELLRLKRGVFRDLDLSFARFGRVLLEACEFENVNLTGMQHAIWNERGCRFCDVQLRDVKLRNAALGLGGSAYERVDFSRCDFGDAFFYRPQFRGCTFASPKFRGLDFNMSNFAGCSFSGQLDGVWFRAKWPHPHDEATFGPAAPNEMRVDFSDASLWDVVFTGGLDLSRVVLPRDGQHVLLKDFCNALLKSKKRVESLGDGGLDQEHALQLIQGFLVHAAHQDMWILNQRDMEQELGEATGRFLFQSLVEFDKTAP